MGTGQGSTQKDSGKPSEQSGDCKNCGHHIPPVAVFCPQCGQKTASRLIPLREVISDLLDSAFSINSKLFRSLRLLFVPGRLAQDYFGGKQIRYYSPPRLFFVTLAAMYTVLGLFYLADLETKVPHRHDRQSGMIQDTADIPEMVTTAEEADTPLTRQGTEADSLLIAQDRVVVTNMLGSGFIWLPSSDTVIQLSTEEDRELEVDSLFKKYAVTSLVDRLLAQPQIRAQREPGKLAQTIIANSFWMILLLMPALSFVLKLLYIRRQHYYVEHLVLLFYTHAAIFSVMTLCIPLLRTLPVWLGAAIPVSYILFLLLALKFYYRQGWLKTVVKFLLLLLSYLGILIAFGGLTLVVSFLLFQ